MALKDLIATPEEAAAARITREFRFTGGADGTLRALVMEEVRNARISERERCARVAEAHVICDWSKLPGKAVDDTFGKQIAAAIRAME